MTKDNAPDFPPRTVTITIVPGEDLIVDGEQGFAVYELAAIYTEARERLFDTEEAVVVETCPSCGAALSPEEGDTA